LRPFLRDSILRGMATGDLNGDGKIDIAVADYDWGFGPVIANLDVIISRKLLDLSSATRRLSHSDWLTKREPRPWGGRGQDKLGLTQRC
jgi:hypothetical protein